MRLNIKKTAVILFLILLLPMFSACTKGFDGIKIALDFEDKDRYTELFNYFTTETGIKITATYGEDIGKLVGTKDEPDIIKTSTVVVLSMQDSLRDLTPFMNQYDVNGDDYIASIIAALTVDGKIYALPTSVNTSLLYYNRKLFDASAAELRMEFNLTSDEDVYPKADWTYDDYQKAGVILSKCTVNAKKERVYTQFGAETQMNWWGEWLVYLYQMGGTFYKPNTNNRILALDSPEAMAATEFYVKKAMGDANEKFAPNAVEAVSGFSFLNGNVAMIFGGHMGDWYSYDLLGLDWGIQVLPTPVGKSEARGGEISADAFGISARSKKPDEAFLFLKMMAGETGAIHMYKYGKIGALKDMKRIIDELPEKDKGSIDIDVVFQAGDKAVVLPREKDFSKVCREMVMSELYKLMFTGRGSETDIEPVLSRIKTNVDKYYQELYG
ncbi:MAG: extracellular solute-binding protein [Bacilli bacterium]|nr:extracellular solute-binding protein [Bacilli bacterium]